MEKVFLNSFPHSYPHKFSTKCGLLKIIKYILIKSLKKLILIVENLSYPHMNVEKMWKLEDR